MHAYVASSITNPGGCVCGLDRNDPEHKPVYRVADAEQARSTGGMVALFPRQDFAEAMVVEGGEPLEELHLTLAYLGEDVTDMPADGVLQAVAQIADSLSEAVTARVFAHAIFNPDSGPAGDMDPCAVYLVSDSDLLGPLRHAVQDLCSQQFQMPNQHEPFIPHITASYAIQRLNFTGTVIFDRISVCWAGEQHDFPLLSA